MEKKTGIIAGWGEFPVLVASRARELGYEVFTVSLDEGNRGGLRGCSTKLLECSPGQLKKMLRFFKQYRVDNITLSGKVEKVLLFRLRPDSEALKLLWKTRDRRDDTLLGAVCDYFEKEGIRVRNSLDFVEDLLVQQGKLTKFRISREDWKNLEFGYGMAKSIAGLDIGQTVVVKDRTVVAVESIEGTDAAITRGCEYGGEGVYVIKVAKPRQDLRFDIPALGEITFQTCARGKARYLAVEAGKSLFFQKKSSLSLAEKYGVRVLGIPEGWDGKPF